MPGAMIAAGPCVLCGDIFTFNVERVPSADGKPICSKCIVLVNDELVKQGKKPVVIYDNSYDDQAF